MQICPPIAAGKLSRLASGLPLRVLDLFSGCGGLSLGFQRAGFEILGGLEKDERAAEVYARNLHRGSSADRQKLLARSRDISSCSPVSLLHTLGHDDPNCVDLLIGGPPCQAYARVGRAKLREIAAHPEAFRQDERGRLYLEYLTYVRELRPLALLLENVPDILSYGGRNVAREIAVHLNELGYLVNIGLLNAAHYGIPQHRRRVYLMAFHRALDLAPSFPAPTHRTARLPSGYREFAALVAALGRGGAPFSGPIVESSAAQIETLPEAVTVRQAIGDLPRLTAHLRGISAKARRVPECLPYEGPPLSEFARTMRAGWPGFEADERVRDQVTRRLCRDFPIFARMKPDDDYPEACRIANALFKKELARQRRGGRDIRAETTDWHLLRKSMVPPYDPSKFPNKWWKMNPEAPSRTLLAHLAHDSYTHIHYDDVQARTLSVREAARLQSFPDGFHFAEAMNPSFRMIGNAVPPLMAFQLANHLLQEMRQAARSRQTYALAS